MSGPLYLNIGCGKVKLPGFVNIDLEPGADVVCDVTRGLPYEDGTVDGIYSEHFIEHLSQKDIISFFRECRRVLKPGGRVRVATPDLDVIVRRYAEHDWRQPWLQKYGYDWIRNRAEYLNIALRAWGHAWVVNEEELARLAALAGLEDPVRCMLNESQDEMFCGLETRVESTLIMEFRKRRERFGEQPLVSIVIPAFRSEFLDECLQSALAQTYENIEILVLDDSASPKVEKITAAYSRCDQRVVYYRNEPPLGEAANLTKGIRLARGEFIKPLYDDDTLAPDAVARLLAALRATPEARLAAGRRVPINEGGVELEPGVLGVALADVDGRLRGTAVIGRILSSGVNMLGEPTCMLFRRADAVAIDEPNVMSLFGRLCVGIGDVCLALHLLSRGDLAYVAEPVARFRLHPGQTQRRPMVRTAVQATWAYVREQAVRLGFPLSGPEMAQPTHHRERSCATDTESREAYRVWRSKRTLTEVDAEVFAERMMLKWGQRPAFVCVLVLEPGQEALLADTIDSLAAQFYRDWRLVVVAPFPAPDPAFNEVEQLFWIEADSPEAKVEAINGVAASVGTHWLWFLPPGSRLEPHTFLRFGDYIDLRPDWRLIYADDDRLMADGEFGEPRFKPDFNLDLARSMDYFGPVLVRADALLTAGGASLLQGAETYDVTLRLLDAFGEGAIGHVADVLVHLPRAHAASANEEAARLAVAMHLERRGVKATVEAGYAAGTHRVIYARQWDPLVTIIIPNRDKYEFLQPCVESLLEKTAYPHYEILIVDNRSTDPDVLDYYGQLQARYPERIRILRYDAEFNFSAMNNLAAREARGEYLLLLNNDTQIVQAEWLERLLQHGQRPEVGVVGARCVYPETGKLQHAGVVLGLTSLADHPFNGQLGLDEPGYMNRAQVDQNYSAVTAACMLVRKAVYFQVGGFDEIELPVLFNDVDLCLKVGKAGYKVVWTPYATVVHHGSTSLKGEAVDLMKLALGQERAKRERAAMMARWMPMLARDPAYNPHLSLRRPGYQVETSIVIDWDVNFHDRPRLLGLPLSGGSGEYRVISPFRALSRAGLAHGDVVLAPKMFETRLLTPVELARAQPDTLVLHAAAGEANLEAMGLYREFNRDVLLVYALDDLVTQLPRENPFFRHTPRDMRSRLRKALSLCHRVVVSTEPIAELCRPLNDDVRVVPNRLERAIWGGLVSRRRQGPRPRVGWAGAQQHAGDLAIIVEVVKATASEVDWVFFGMCPEELRPFVREFHDFVVSFYDYPAKLASLNLDLAVAPLALNAFNEAKSNLRLLEYGILGWPVVCTDIYPYQNAPVKRVPNEPGAWIEAIRERVHDLDAAAAEGDRLREWVLRHFILEDHLEEWLDALTREEAAALRGLASSGRTP